MSNYDNEGVKSGADPTLALVENQLSYFDQASKRSFRAFIAIKLVQIVAAAVIPLPLLYDGTGDHRFLSAGLGALIVIAEGIQGLGHFQEAWIRRRSSWDALRREKHLFEANAGPYSENKNAGRLFAERVDAILGQHVMDWKLSLITKDKDK